ncbi:MAG: amidohydrolase family protein [Alphaproteobacteria bacterium]|nr:amidohydrolase family protein [Alphaproteobacteria bacterium]
MIDTHLHLIDRAALDYPWLSQVPPLNRDFLWAEYQALADRCGITQSIFMEVDVTAPQNWAEMAYVGSLSRAYPDKLVAAIMAGRPESPEFIAPNLAHSQKFIKGMRRVLHVLPPEQLRDILSSDIFVENLRRLGELGFTFDLCIPIEAADEIARVIDAVPNLTFILDHAGRPNIDTKTQPDNHQAWRHGIKHLSKRRNVVVKISGLIDRADPVRWRLADLRPFIETVISEFGWQRVIWGSDWPVCNLAGGLSEWAAASRALVADCSPDEQNALFHENAQRIYHVK